MAGEEERSRRQMAEETRPTGWLAGQSLNYDAVELRRASGRLAGRDEEVAT